MNFNTFWEKLKALQEGISIDSPAIMKVKRCYWGAPPKALAELPAVLNAVSESERTLGFGSREQRLRVNVQMLVAKATVEDVKNAQIATAFWFAAKDAFDRDYTIDGSVSFSTLRGADPTVPVVLSHANLAYIGFNAFLEIDDFRAFDFSGGD